MRKIFILLLAISFIFVGCEKKSDTIQNATVKNQNSNENISETSSEKSTETEMETEKEKETDHLSGETGFSHFSGTGGAAGSL